MNFNSEETSNHKSVAKRKFFFDQLVETLNSKSSGKRFITGSIDGKTGLETSVRLVNETVYLNVLWNCLAAPVTHHSNQKALCWSRDCFRSSISNSLLVLRTSLKALNESVNIVQILENAIKAFIGANVNFQVAIESALQNLLSQSLMQYFSPMLARAVYKLPAKASQRDRTRSRSPLDAQQIRRRPAFQVSESMLSRLRYSPYRQPVFPLKQSARRRSVSVRRNDSAQAEQAEGSLYRRPSKQGISRHHESNQPAHAQPLTSFAAPRTNHPRRSAKENFEKLDRHLDENYVKTANDDVETDSAAYLKNVVYDNAACYRKNVAMPKSDGSSGGPSYYPRNVDSQGVRQQHDLVGVIQWLCCDDCSLYSTPRSSRYFALPSQIIQRNTSSPLTESPNTTSSWTDKFFDEQ